MATVGILAGTLVTVCVVPQLVAALRSTEVGGVSVTASAYAATACAGWTLYALHAGLVEAAWSSGIGAALWGMIAVVAGRRNQQRPSPSVGVWAAAILGAAATLGNDRLGLLLLGEAVANTVPQAIRARNDASGVSSLTFVLMGIAAAGWVVYGVGSGDVPLAVSSAVKAAVCAAIVELIRRRRRRRPVAAEPRVLGVVHDQGRCVVGPWSGRGGALRDEGQES